MKRDRISLFFILNLFILISCIVLGYKSFADAKKYAGEGNLYISPVFNDNNYYFSLDEIKRLEDLYPNYRFTFEKFSYQYAANGTYEKYIKIVYTDSRYFKLNNFDFKEGGPWAENYDRKRAAVVTESLGWYLFGSLDICGKFIAVDGQMYQISGIVSQSDIMNDGFYAWIPYESTAYSGSDISNIYIHSNSYNPVDAFSTVKSCLQDLSKSEVDYKITDLNQYRDNIGLKYQFVLLILAGACSIYLCLHIYHLAVGGRAKKEKAGYIAVGVILFLFTAGMVFFIKGSIENNLWITSEPFSLTSAMKILGNADGLPGREYMPYHLNQLNEINNKSTLFAIGALLSMINIFFTGKHIKIKKPDSKENSKL